MKSLPYREPTKYLTLFWFVFKEKPSGKSFFLPPLFFHIISSYTHTQQRLARVFREAFIKEKKPFTFTSKHPVFDQQNKCGV